MIITLTSKRVNTKGPSLCVPDFRHTYVSNLCKSGMDAFVAMKIAGHADYQTTANICTNPDDEMERKTGARPDEVFERKDGAGDVVKMRSGE